MPLAAGSRFGNFDLVALLGVGGMGAVYRARDRKLNRVVALKLLPEEFARDADRCARFELRRAGRRGYERPCAGRREVPAVASLIPDP